MRWYKFDASKGCMQRRPPVKKWVLVKLKKRAETLPEGVAVGYRKNAAGDKKHPYFVIPGIGGEVLAWCDCLPANFDYPRGI